MLKRHARPHEGRRTERARKLRTETSLSERVLWDFIRNDKLGYRFRRQYPIENFTLDFYCPSKKLCIEVDGEQHFDTLKQDKQRDEKLSALGIKAIRIPSLDLFEQTTIAFSAWLKIIEEALQL